MPLLLWLLAAAVALPSRRHTWCHPCHCLPPLPYPDRLPWLPSYPRHAQVVLMRSSCRGRNPYGLAKLPSPPRPGWFRPRWMLIPIRMILFLTSIVFSSTLFFVWQVRFPD